MGVHIARDELELRAAMESLSDPVVQEYLPIIRASTQLERSCSVESWLVQLSCAGSFAYGNTYRGL